MLLSVFKMSLIRVCLIMCLKVKSHFVRFYFSTFKLNVLKPFIIQPRCFLYFRKWIGTISLPHLLLSWSKIGIVGYFKKKIWFFAFFRLNNYFCKSFLSVVLSKRMLKQSEKIWIFSLPTLTQIIDLFNPIRLFKSTFPILSNRLSDVNE